MEGASSQLPFVSVVLPAEHAEGDLSRCLASLARLEYPRDRYEIVLVVDRPAEAAGHVASDRIRVMTEARPGVCHARNAGIIASRGEVVAFTDTDCSVSTIWLRELARGFDDPGVGVVAGAIFPFPPTTDAERYAARRASHSQLRPLSAPEHAFALSPNLAFRRQPLVRVGMFDPTFPGGGWEDADLCWRFGQETGLALAYSPRAVVFHRYRSTASAFLAQHYRYGYGLGLLYAKHRHELAWRWPTDADAQIEVARAARRWGTLVLADVLGSEPRRPEERTEAKFDCLRLLGQRAGFLRALAATAVARPPRALRSAP
jgi:cellulose synthase/poly-beta-1,6-N-acetylglucosamine synthase-like glycosyltransferase